MGTKNEPGEFDCYAKAKPDEPLFVLLGRDPCAPLLVSLWAALHANMGDTETLKLAEAQRVAEEMKEWAIAYGTDFGKAQRAMQAVLFDARNSGPQIWSPQ